MYCDKCRKKNPDNFITCAYCGEKLNIPKKKESYLEKVTERKKQKTRKHKIAGATGFSVFLVIVVVIIAALIIGSKPEKVVKTFAESIKTTDKDLYYSIYDENIKRYKKENRYFGDEETFEHFVLPMVQSDDFYKEKCGDDYKLTYKVISDNALTEEELQVFNEVLENNFGYIEIPSKVNALCVEINVKGEKGDYKSLYNDFWCMRIKGRWYKVDKAIYTEYINLS